MHEGCVESSIYIGFVLEKRAKILMDILRNDAARKEREIGKKSESDRERIQHQRKEKKNGGE